MAFIIYFKGIKLFSLDVKITLSLSTHAVLWNNAAKTEFTTLSIILKTKVLYIGYSPLPYTWVDFIDVSTDLSLCLPPSCYQLSPVQSWLENEREECVRNWESFIESSNHPSQGSCNGWWQQQWAGRELRCYHWGNWSNVPCPDGRYVTLRERESWKAMSSAASSLRSSTRPSPASIRELAMSKAAWESPSAEMMAACFCCSA